MQWMDQQEPDVNEMLEAELLQLVKNFPDTDLWQEEGVCKSQIVPLRYQDDCWQYMKYTHEVMWCMGLTI